MSVVVQTMTVPASAAAIPNRAPSVPTPIVDGDQLGDQLSELQPRLSIPRRPLPSTPTVSRNSNGLSASPRKRTARVSYIASARSTGLGLATVCANTKILSCLLGFLLWTDFHSLSGASRALRCVFLDVNVKDTVFSHFIPGYRTALRAKDRRLWEDNIRMNYADLSLLVAALDTPLHRFPMHALSVLSSGLPTWEQMRTTKRLQLLSKVHSRVVLLLQNLVHSNARLALSDLDDPHLKTNASAAQTGLRELTFPAPLSYTDLDATKGKSDSSKSSLSSSRHTASASSLKLLSPKSLKRYNRKWGPETIMPETDVMLSKRGRSSPRLSIFGGNAQHLPLPQPAAELASLRFYSGNWRRSYYGSSPSEDGVLKPPKRRFVSSRYSSNSSLGSSPSHSSSRQVATPGSSSLHDLYAATKRNRAPILRVFIPCSKFTDELVTACEDQLIDDGLWEHMSVGDVVCNFGYVPLVDEAEENAQEKDHRQWLVFTGERLEIYHPTRPPPILSALSLPSPFYYTHILPAFTNPRLRLTLPAFRAQYSLTVLTTKVASPHAPSGYARVKTFAWLASLNARPSPGSPMNPGWAGEWVLQGEGTPEGKIALQNALRGGQETEHEYEIVLENSGGGKLWLRMLTFARTMDNTDLRTSHSD